MSEAMSHRGGEGPPLVLIHGFSDTWRGWASVLPALERSHDVLAVTLAGHFEGPRLPDGTRPSAAALVDAVERDMDAAGFATAHVAGNSLGGWAALELAARGRARSVTALAPAGGWEHEDRRVARRLRRIFRVNHRLATLAAPHAEAMMRRPRIRAVGFAGVAVHPTRIPPAAAAHMVRGVAGCDVYQDLLDHLASEGFPEFSGPITCPTRIAWSQHDRLILGRPAYHARLERLVPSAEVVTLPGVGHVPMHDDPELVVRTIGEVTARAQAPASVATG